MKQHIVTFLLLLLSIFFYSLGAVRPGTIFLVVGGIAEMIVWLRIFGRRKRKAD